MTFVIAVCDRTGRLLPAVRDAGRDDDLEVVVVPDGPDLERDDTDADLLLVGARELTAAGLRRVGTWLDRHPDAVAMAHLDPGVTSRPSVEELRAAGVAHWLEADAADVARQLPAALDRALSGTEAPALVPDRAPAPVPEAGDEVAYVLTVASASGGSGKTFFAANTATFIADQGHRVLLVDLDLQFGEVGAALQLKHPYSIYDGLYDGTGAPLPDDAFEQHLHELVHPTSLGFDVLLAPRDPTVGESITAEDVELVLSVTTQRYDVVIVDTPPALTEPVLSVLDRSDVVAVLSTLDVPSLRNLTSFLDVLRRIDVGRDRVRLVLNKVESDIGIDVAQAQEAFGGRFVATLPAGKSASRSINTGTVVLRSEPKGPVARALVASMSAVLPAELLPAPAVDDAPDAAQDPAHAAKGLRSLLRLRRPVSGGTP